MGVCGVTSPRFSSSSRANGAEAVRASAFWEFLGFGSSVFGVPMLYDAYPYMEDVSVYFTRAGQGRERKETIIIA